MATISHFSKGRLNYAVTIQISHNSRHIIGRDNGIKNAEDFRATLERANDLNGFSASEIEGLILDFQKRADELEGATQ